MSKVEKRANQGAVAGATAGAAHGYGARRAEVSDFLGKSFTPSQHFLHSEGMRGAARKGLKFGAAGAVAGAGIGLAERRSTHRGRDKK